MSQILKWEENFLKIERTIFELTKIAAHLPDPKVSNQTIADRDQVDQALAAISISSSRASQLSKNIQNASRSNAAICYWGKQLTAKIKSVAEEYVALQNRKMWLRTLQLRYTGQSSQDSIDLHARHLVDLASRKRNLAQLEISLKRDLRAASCERDILTLEYEAISIADQNWSASGSFQARLGKNVEHARKNPSTCALSDGLKIVSIPSHFPEESLSLRLKNESLTKKSQTLCNSGGALAAALAKGSGGADYLSVSSFKSILAEVSELNQQVSDKLESLYRRSPERSHPKVVQKLQKQVKT